MFTGIIQAIGEVRQVEQRGSDARYVIGAGGLEMDDVEIGDSIATQGVCLTAIELGADYYAADVSGETLSRTTFNQLKPGAPVNLEKSVTPTTRLGGHLVSGHVDGLGSLLSERNDGRSIRYQFSVPQELAHYIAEKGSITIDGTSLTVNHVDDNRFGVNIVPHTRQNTIFQHYQINTQVNIEVDIIARYLERLLTGQKPSADGQNSQLLKALNEAGFIK